MTDSVLTINGEVSSIRRFDSGWCIANVVPDLDNGKPAILDAVTVVGALPGVTEGMNIAVTAKKAVHEKYGTQYKIVDLLSCGYSTLDGLKKYLAGDEFPDVGDITAALIVNHFGENVVEILDADPERVFEVKGANSNRLKRVAELWAKARNNHRGSLELIKLGLTSALAHRAIKHFEHENILDVLKSNPYRLTEVRGIGFTRADEVALRCNILRDSPRRIEAAIVYILDEYGIQGHCYMNTNRLIASVCDLLNVESHQVGACISTLRKSGDIVIDGASTYSAEMYNAEVEVAGELIKMLQYPHGNKHYSNYEQVESDLSDLPNFDSSIKLDGLQLQAIMTVLNERVCVITGGPGTGKAQPVDAMVLTPNGPRQIGTLLPGDKVLHPHGGTSTVDSIHPQGIKMVNRVYFNDETSTECCDEHLWAVQTRNDRINNRPCRVITTLQMKERLLMGDNGRRMYVPRATHLDFKPKSLPIDPYALGLLLGDGSLNKGTIGFTTADDELVSMLQSRLDTNCQLKSKGKRVIEYVITRTGNCREFGEDGRRGCSLLYALKKLGLRGVTSWTKFIPDCYLYASQSQRLELLQGLMDTDGTCGRNTPTAEFSSCSVSLAKSVVWLVRSLGGRATIRVKRGWYNDNRHYSWRVTLSLPPGMVPFKLKRKIDRYANRTNRPLGKMVSKIEYSRLVECVCIKLDREDGLYCTDDCIVTHNTTITKALVSLLERHGYSYELCSPTGRAAKRLSESSGKQARTIHRLLAWQPTTGTFMHNASMPLNTNFVLVDEFSMVDLRLFRDLLRALEPNTRIVMIGDKDQLPSVGAGNVLHDIIDSGVVPVVRLNKVFRQESGNTIVDVAHSIVGGEVPELPTPKDSKGKNCMMVNVGDDSSKMQSFILQLITKEIPKLTDDNGVNLKAKDVQILTPRRTGKYSVEEMNPWMQAVVNPEKPGVDQIKDGFRILRVGDRVMQVKNNYTLGDTGVFNGDIGYIVSSSMTGDGPLVQVRYPDIIHPVEYNDDSLDQIQHAWVSTVHKSQGSEIPVVIFILQSCHGIMLQRNLLYTGVTRAKKICLIMGEHNALVTAINNDKVINRHTGLSSRLQEMANFD